MRDLPSQVDGILALKTIGIGARWTIVILCCYISSHCALRPTPRDLTIYVNRDIYGIAELESMALKHYEQLTGPNFVSDQALRESLTTQIIPVYRRFTDRVGRIKPDTVAVQKLHAKYRSAAALRLQGFQTILLAIDTQDPDALRQANRMLGQGQQFAKEWRENMKAMAKQHGLKLK